MKEGSNLYGLLPSSLLVLLHTFTSAHRVLNIGKGVAVVTKSVHTNYTLAV